MSEEIQDENELVEKAMQYRWYSLTTIYAVKVIDDDGHTQGFMRALFVNKDEAHRVAKKVHGLVVEYVEREVN